MALALMTSQELRLAAHDLHKIKHVRITVHEAPPLPEELQAVTVVLHGPNYPCGWQEWPCGEAGA